MAITILLLFCLISLNNSFNQKSYTYKGICSRNHLLRRASVSNIKDQITPPPEPVLRVIDRNKRLSVADVSALSGMDLRSARSSLISLASLTGADLDVTRAGEILYSFPENYRNILLKRSLGQRIRNLFNVVKGPLFYLFRISFGVCLILSLATIGATFAFVSININSDERDKKENKRGNVNIFLNGYGPSPLDLIRYGGSSNLRNSDDNSSIGFLESFYSYIFGDGDPNQDFTSEQLRNCAAVIRANNGVVVAEQLAPYLDPPVLEEAIREGPSSLVSEQWILPVIVRLNGLPVVTEDGDLVYMFPDLMLTALDTHSEAPEAQPVGKVPTLSYSPRPYAVRPIRDSGTAPFLTEGVVPFSKASPYLLVLAGGLGLVNLFGAVSLLNIIRNGFLISSSPVLGFVAKIYPLLLAYAVLYNLIPAIRWLSVQQTNSQIFERNEKRKDWSAFLQSKDVILARKLAAAEEQRANKSLVLKSIDAEEIVYSTSEEYSRAAEERALQEFDKRL